MTDENTRCSRWRWQRWRLPAIPNTLEAMQQMVGGYTEVILWKMGLPGVQ